MKWIIFLTTLAALFALRVAAAPPLSTFTTVALRPSSAQEPGTVYGELGIPALNHVGQIAYKERIFDSVTRQAVGDALWIYDGGDNSLLARTGEALRGDPAAGSFVGFGSYPYNFALNNSGQLAVYALATGATGIWRVDQDGWMRIAHEGQVAPGSGSRVFGEFARNDTLSRRQPRPLINDRGDVVFPGILEPPVDPYVSSPYSYNGVWRWTDASGHQRVFGYGDTHIQDGSTFVFYYPDEFDLALNDMGDIAGIAEVSADNHLWSVAWLFRDGQLQVVAPPNKPLNGIDGATRVVGSRLMGLNNRGELAVFLGYRDSNNLVQSGIWKGSPDNLELVVLEESTITVNGIDYLISHISPVATTLNAAGDYVTAPSLVPAESPTQPPQAGIMFNIDNQLRFGPLPGDRAPGTDATFRSLGLGTYNGLGQFVFQGRLEAPTESNNGIWAIDALGNVRLIVREGDEIEIAPGDVRKITGIAIHSGSGNEDGALSSFNDRGELALRLAFADGSNGIFISRALVIPEPSTWHLALVFIASCTALRTQRQKKA
jgi:hypothetical protein